MTELPSPRSAAADLVSLVTDAALQRLLQRPCQADLALIRRTEEPWHFDYAVGTDVVMLHADPWGNAAAAGDQRKIGFGEVFRPAAGLDDAGRHEELARMAAVAAALGEFICYELTGVGRPLLLFPAVSGQLRHLIETVGSKLNLPRSEDDRQLAGLLGRLRAGERRLTREDLSVLRRADGQAGAYSQLVAIRRLLNARRLINIDLAPLGEPFTPALRVAAMSAAGDNVEQRLLDERRSAWIERLTRVGRDPENSALGVAASAMARLETINRHLAALGARQRLLYVTGDTSLMAAGDEVPLWADARLDADPWLQAEPTFTNAFLRHPRSFLEFPSVLRLGIDTQEPSFSDLLTVWLGSLGDLDRQGRSTLVERNLPRRSRERIEAAAASDQQAPLKIRHDWAEATERVARVAPPKSFLAILQRSTGRKDVFEELIASLATFDQELHEAWASFTNVLIEFRTTIDFTNPVLPREAPPLCFERQAAVTTFFREAENWLSSRRGFTKALYDDHRRAIMRDRIDGADYFLNLAHAWLLSVQGHWRSAGILARRAIASVPKGQSPIFPDGPNGREASFLDAVCLRHTAKSERDLNGAEERLQEFYSIALREGAMTAGRDIVPERYGAERIAIRLSRELFRWHESTDKRRHLVRIVLLEPEIREHIRAVERRIVGEAEAEIERVVTGAPPVFNLPFHHDRLLIRLRLLRRAWRNMFGMGLMHPVREDLAEEAWSELRFLEVVSRFCAGNDNQAPAADGVEQLRKIVELFRVRALKGVGPLENVDDSLGSRSLFGEFVAACGTVRFFSANAPSQEQLKAWQAARDRLVAIRRDLAQSGPDHEQPLIVFPYDAARFGLWLENILAPNLR